MNFDIQQRTILLVKHGSTAYGLNTPESDLDLKGIAIPPANHYFGLHTFEQHVEEARAGAPHDSVIYGLQKFTRLAADGNPNIIEVLFGDDADILHSHRIGLLLREQRELFISKKVKHTFSGYAYSQLQRIKSHRAWLLNPPKKKPERIDFGILPNTPIPSHTERGAFDALEVDGQLDQIPITVQKVFGRERAYQSAYKQWQQYEGWKRARNPERASIEAKWGYDCKHASHLVRLLTMCKEILSGHGVQVKRTLDREYLLAIKRGYLTYDQLINIAEGLDRDCADLYITSYLPHHAPIEKIDALVTKLTHNYLKENP